MAGCVATRHQVVYKSSTLCSQENQCATYCQEESFHICIAPWSLLQITPQLHHSCPKDKAGYTSNLIEITPAIPKIWATKVSIFLPFFFFKLQEFGIKFLSFRYKNIHKQYQYSVTVIG